MKRLVMLVGVSLVLLGAHAPSRAAAAFGLSEFSVTATGADGAPATLAGSHPFAFTTALSVNTRADGSVEQNLKDLTLSQMAGLVGDPTATPRCDKQTFLSSIEGIPPIGRNSLCPDDTVVGAAAISASVAKVYSPVFNLRPRKGVAAEIGFNVIAGKVPVTVAFEVSKVWPFNVVAKIANAPQPEPFYSSVVTLWGNPADPAHDPFRGTCLELAEPNTVTFPTLPAYGSCPSDAPDTPFLTLPRACGMPLVTSFVADSWQNPLTKVEGTSAPLQMEGCGSLRFEPEVEATPTTSQAESPSGMSFDLDLDTAGLLDPAGRSSSDLEKVVVDLPPGMTTNPSTANGLGACSLSQYEAEGVDPAGGCPDSSRIGSVEVESPLLEKGEGGEGLETLTGSVFVAKQGENPFHNLLTLYVTIEDPQRGIFVRFAGKVEPDPATGQLRTVFGEPESKLPQLPFSHFRLKLRSGERAPLITPTTCGTYATEVLLYPTGNELQPVDGSAAFSVSQGSGSGGDPCSSNTAQLPNSRSFNAGTLNAGAGSFSPFVLNLARPDGSQQLSRIDATLPEGLLGRLSGITYCPDAAIAQAVARAGEGEGLLESAQPSCPAASQVGTVTATAGAGTEPLTVTGKAYLAGPYRGAPLSLEIITPAIAGPFDLGVVAVRTALQVDPLTTQITAESDPIPTILHGLPLDLRSISIDMDRPSFILNPTSCEPKAITGSAISTLGNVATLAQYFQASNCAALVFRPKLKLSLSGSTKHAGHPGLKAVLTYPKGPGYANIARAQVNLPHSEFIDQGNLNKTCTRPKLLEGACPPSTVYGKAKAWSPLLEAPLSGNVYLVGGFGYQLPALVAELNGQIRVLLVGKVDSGPNHGIRNTFEVVPDAPVERFELKLKGGKKYSLLENSEDLCKRPQRAIARFTAQSGRVQQTEPVVANGCGKSKKKPKEKGAKKARRRKAK